MNDDSFGVREIFLTLLGDKATRDSALHEVRAQNARNHKTDEEERRRKAIAAAKKFEAMPVTPLDAMQEHYLVGQVLATRATAMQDGFDVWRTKWAAKLAEHAEAEVPPVVVGAGEEPRRGIVNKLRSLVAP